MKFSTMFNPFLFGDVIPVFVGKGIDVMNIALERSLLCYQFGWPKAYDKVNNEQISYHNRQV
jgi:hypothetical protein